MKSLKSRLLLLLSSLLYPYLITEWNTENHRHNGRVFVRFNYNELAG